MTEKRYYEKRYGDEFYILDSEKISEKEFDEKLEIEGYKAFEDSLTGEEVVKLLNENEQLKAKNEGFEKDLQETMNIFKEFEKENEQLKQSINQLKIQNSRFMQEVAEYSRKSKELEKENEKLKAQLYCNHDGGVCSICKHCYLDEQSLYYISKCEKGHEKCSKEDLRYCDDFELKGDAE